MKGVFLICSVIYLCKYVLAFSVEDRVCCLLGLYSEHHFPFKSHISHLPLDSDADFVYRIEDASSSNSYLLPCEKYVWLVLFL